MLLIHGTRYFTIKSFLPAELDLFGKCDPGIQFLRQQEYFHLFFIPVFGTGKRWMMRNANGQIGFVPPEFVHHLKSYNKIVRSPWYTFIGLFAAIIILTTAIFLIAKRVNEHDARNKKEYEQAYVGLKEKISKAKQNDLFHLKIIRGDTIHTLIMRIVEISDDSLILDYDNESLWSGAGNYTHSCQFYSQISDSTEHAKIRLSRKDISEAITPQTGFYTVKKLHTQKIDGAVCQYTITEIEPMNKPKLICTNYYNLPVSGQVVEMEYRGLIPGKIISINNLTLSCQWKLEGDSALTCNKLLRFYSESSASFSGEGMVITFETNDDVRFLTIAERENGFALQTKELK